MDNSDLISAIDMVRDALMSHEEENQFQRIIDRLEGYELAYNVLLQKVEVLEKRLNELAQTSYCIICGDDATEVRQGRFYCDECCN